MAKTVFLHIGMPKCASTTIQGYLATQSDALAEAGLAYDIWPGDTRADTQGNGVVLAEALLAGRKRQVRSCLDFFLRGAGDVVLSSELFFGLFRGSELPALISEFQTRGYGTRVICFLRRQDHWIESDFKQQIKSGSDWFHPIEQLVTARSEQKALNYAWILSEWGNVVGLENIAVEPLHPGQRSEETVKRFLSHLGAASLAEVRAEMSARNVSPPAGLIEPARMLKRAMMHRGLAPAKTVEPLEAFFAEASQGLQVPQRRFLLSYTQRKRLVHRFAEANDILARRFLGGAAPFDDVVDQDPASDIPLGQEAGELLAQYFMPDLRDYSPLGLLSRGAARAKRLVQ